MCIAWVGTASLKNYREALNYDDSFLKIWYNKTMIICNCILHLELPYVQSLKGRRSVTNSMKEKLKAFNLSVLDVSGEYAKEADIAFAFLSQNSLGSAQYREKIEKMLERNFSEYHFDLEYEEIWMGEILNPKSSTLPKYHF